MCLSDVEPFPRSVILDVKCAVSYVEALWVSRVMENLLKDLLLRGSHLSSEVGNDRACCCVVW